MFLIGVCYIDLCRWFEGRWWSYHIYRNGNISHVFLSELFFIFGHPNQRFDSMTHDNVKSIFTLAALSVIHYPIKHSWFVNI